MTSISEEQLFNIAVSLNFEYFYEADGVFVEYEKRVQYLRPEIVALTTRGVPRAKPTTTAERPFRVVTQPGRLIPVARAARPPGARVRRTQL
ncbi:hypothetical protein EVAR_4276_1 [Eumeta japonica]|uniref:Uncharacterized protein n=1 Tax=Eumeta variegata TaxID=151549 RepID=A0A4C1VCW4_EUMVA|nr:hypothetical protein EVAR_4276_1 [Eumeta japonica]